MSILENVMVYFYYNEQLRGFSWKVARYCGLSFFKNSSFLLEIWK